ncbi:glutamyl-tRNA reductase precursor [Dunaliella salina]|uniref:Glutamyl-tRNA reductase n=1 Tax=Dunaliella salina TaxID=3046 RepID=A0ABQ7HAB7_DUNSA|nr:glutamyl-tRNA reductase precursor [Dunaliella salina]|eukprot:KAF5843797.1 glutamyl-tRNA reductase precursor [Dunaliella salina]
MQTFSRTPRRIAGGGRRIGGGSGQGLPRPVAQQPPLLQCPAAISAQADVSTSSPSTSTSQGIKLPASHKESSRRALEQLKDNSLNRYATQAKSSIISIGLTIHNTPVELREKLAVPEAEWPRAIEELCSYPHIEEAGVLSTCNRLELYVVAVSWHRGVREVEDWMSRSSGVPLEEMRPYLFLLKDRDATKHLMRVSGGLDSLVMGEGQILAQVKQVYKVGQNCPGFGRSLNGLFKQAITAGKRVRAETSISTGSVSVSSAAVELAQLKLPTHSWDDARACIIGAGKMSTLLVKHLYSKGCREVLLLNRSLPRAEALAAEYPDMRFSIHLMSDLLKCVEEADVVFAASGSEELLINKEDLVGMSKRPEVVGGVRRFVDISVPRNIAANVNELQGEAIVYNVDDLKEVVAGNKEARAQAAAEAEVLICQEQRSFEGWRDSLETVPTIKALRSKVEGIRAAEFEKTVHKLGDGVNKKQLRAVEELSKAIVNKLLHGPMTALRCDGTDPEAVNQTLANMDALEQMFQLSQVDLTTTGGKR